MQTIPELFAAGLWAKIYEWSATTSGTFQTLVFFGVVVVIALILFGWVLIIREQPHRRHHHHSKAAATDTETAQGGGIFSRRHHKHRRKKHRPTNPTLAETGGLPAARDPKSPPKSPL